MSSLQRWKGIYQYKFYKSEIEKVLAGKAFPHWSFLTEKKDNKLYYDGKEIVPVEEQTNILEFLYRDSMVSKSRDGLYAAVSDKYLGISRRDIQRFLNSQESYQITKPVPKKTQTFSIISSAPNEHWQIDLVDMTKYRTRFHFVMNIIDVFSKFVWSFPIVNKEAVTIVKNLEPLLQLFSPKKLQSDNGPEFKNKLMADLCKKYNVQQIYSKSYTSNSQGLVERFNRTMRNQLERLMNIHHTNQWINFHPQVISLYYYTHQSTNKFKPSELHFTNNADDREKALERIKTQAKRPSLSHNIQRFKVGDYVRVPTVSLPENRRNQLFADPVAKWSKPLKILAVIRPKSPFESYRYFLSDVRESFPQYQLMKTDKPVLRPPPVNTQPFVPKVPAVPLEVRRSVRVKRTIQIPDYIYQK